MDLFLGALVKKYLFISYFYACLYLILRVTNKRVTNNALYPLKTKDTNNTYLYLFLNLRYK